MRAVRPARKEKPRSRETQTRTDVYSTITNRIVALLEAGTKPWTQPWQAGHAAGPVSRPLRATGEAYAGVNTLILWSFALERGYASPIWMTYRQAQALGGQVRKGEQSAPVVYAGELQRCDADAAPGEESDVTVRFLKSYRVFNVEQIDGLPQRFHEPAAPQIGPEARIAAADAFFAKLGADIRHGGGAAFYRPACDFIQMPAFESFRSPEDYYATLGHECTHWTRHATRLDRDFGRKRFGDAGYAMEELVAELGAAYLCADLGLTLKDREDHAAYIGSWLKVLRSDTRAIFTAAAHAQRAISYLHQLQDDRKAA